MLSDDVKELIKDTTMPGQEVGASFEVTTHMR